jgi:hypothetical protein
MRSARCWASSDAQAWRRVLDTSTPDTELISIVPGVTGTLVIGRVIDGDIVAWLGPPSVEP